MTYPFTSAKIESDNQRQLYQKFSSASHTEILKYLLENRERMLSLTSHHSKNTFEALCPSDKTHITEIRNVSRGRTLHCTSD